MSDALPQGARRLFSHYDSVDPHDRCCTGMLLAKVMEEGDSADLSWLTRTFSEVQLSGWFERHADRQLSKRSYYFWRWILDQTDRNNSPTRDDLWPL